MASLVLQLHKETSLEFAQRKGYTPSAAQVSKRVKRRWKQLQEKEAKHLKRVHERELLFNPERLVSVRPKPQVVRYRMADDVEARDALVKQTPELANVFLPATVRVRSSHEYAFPRVAPQTRKSWGDVAGESASNRLLTDEQKAALSARNEFAEQLFAQTKSLPLDPYLLQLLTAEEIIQYNLEAGVRKALLRHAVTNSTKKPSMEKPSAEKPPVQKSVRIKIEGEVKTEQPRKRPRSADEDSAPATSSGHWFDGLIAEQAAV